VSGKPRTQSAVVQLSVPFTTYHDVCLSYIKEKPTGGTFLCILDIPERYGKSFKFLVTFLSPTSSGSSCQKAESKSGVYQALCSFTHSNTHLTKSDMCTTITGSTQHLVMHAQKYTHTQLMFFVLYQNLAV
jgi:hypothetical protein